MLPFERLGAALTLLYMFYQTMKAVWSLLSVALWFSFQAYLLSPLGGIGRRQLSR